MNKILQQYEELCKDMKKFETEKLPLCAAETYISDFCKAPLLSNFEGKYSFVDHAGVDSFIGGEFIVRLNQLLNSECNALFHANYSNADTLTGINCFTVCAMAVLSREDRVLITSPEQGGHASIPIILKSLGIQYDSIPYNYEEYQINYEQLNDLCSTKKYNFLIFCQSDILNPPDLRKVKLPPNMGIIYDGTQTLGLMIANLVQNPLDVGENVILIGGAHKTLPAPACGLIMTNNITYEEKLKHNITPHFLRNTQPNHIAALLMALIEQETFGKQYQEKVVFFANTLANELEQLDFRLAKLQSCIYTYTHQIFILMGNTETDNFYYKAKKYNITLNAKHKRLFSNDGIRLGTQQIARYNWTCEDISMLAQLLYFVNRGEECDRQIRALRKQLIAKKTPQFTFENITIK
ncbi:MAG: amino acid hydroxymethyltransferase [Roseburia sp.]|nr:amino acid hydroxymethyltransferase [Roseburia sp.]